MIKANYGLYDSIQAVAVLHTFGKNTYLHFLLCLAE